MTVSVFDVAKYILDQTMTITHMQLQKILYYCQAWSLVWDENPLFAEKIEAWANGPVVKEVYEVLRGKYIVRSISQGDIAKLTDAQKETIDAVLGFYGKKTAQWLSDLTHMEDPWKNARQGISEGSRSNVEISLASMHEYYSSLPDTMPTND